MTTAFRRNALAGFALSACALAAHAEPAAASAFEATTLSLSADGQIHVTPDEATLTLGVQTKAPSAAAALRDNATRMTQVMAALRGAGIPAKDIQTSNISLSQQFVYQQNESPKPDGYQVDDTVTVTVEDLPQLGPVIDSVTESGANQINGISFGLKDQQNAEDQARLAAVKTLRSRAELYAQAGGYRVGRLINMSEGGGDAVSPQPMAMPMAFAMARKAPTPVSAGEMTVQVSVSALYELVR